MKEQYLIAIRVGNVTLGHVDVDEVTAGDVMDLEDCKTTRNLLDWLEAHAGADHKTAEAALRPMKARALSQMGKEIAAAVSAAVGNESA